MGNHMRDCLAVMSVPFLYICEKKYCTIVTGKKLSLECHWKKIENLHCGNCIWPFIGHY